MAKNSNELYVTPEATAVFPNLFEAKPIVINGQPQGDPIFSLVMLFKPEDVADMKKVAARLAQERWPGRDLKTLQFPFKKGDAEAEKAEQKGKSGDMYRGFIVVKASSKYQPGVVGPDKQDILNASEVYSGCIVRAQVNIKTFSAGVNEGVKCYLNHVMKVRDGERLVGTTAQDAFSGVQGTAQNVDPTGGADDDDEIPF